MALSSLGMAAFTGCVCVFAAGATAQQVSSGAQFTGTKLVLLGTGSPPADPDRSGPASAIVVNDTPYLIDFGAGVVRRAKAAVAERGIEALDPVKLRVVFLTHMHSDHTVGYPDLILTPWVLGRRVPLEVYGPAGLEEMTEYIFAAYRVDFESRYKHYEEKQARRRVSGRQRESNRVCDCPRDGKLRLPFRDKGPCHRDLRRHEAVTGDDRRLPRLRHLGPRSLDARLVVAAHRFSRVRSPVSHHDLATRGIGDQSQAEAPGALSRLDFLATGRR
jgi:hypothetical protein